CNVKDKGVKIIPEANELELLITFSRTMENMPYDPETCMDDTKSYWHGFWEQGGMIRLRNSIDKRALELERRIILSMYLLAAQCAGNMPPQETGLSVNSWYGKFHLEMHLWHQAYLPMWNRGRTLKKSLLWYEEHLNDAKQNAAKNGFTGARWPKMVSETAVDSPSPVAPLLVWQQPHILYMLELCYHENPSEDFLKDHIDLVTETSEFMADFPARNEKDKKYHLLPPISPAQECHNPENTKDPAFELEYFVSGLTIAIEWYKRLDRPVPQKWLDVINNMAESPVMNGKYQAHANCPDTFKTAATDHPSMLCAYGLIDSGRIDRQIMKNTLEAVIEDWDYDSLWGWDFAVMAMTAARLGLKGKAIDLLLADTPKNRYVKSGNNAQGKRQDLPLYLPGNGSLLLAMPLLVAGVEGKLGECAGFPDDGTWCVEYEDINKCPC
ncbi:MAG: glycoside hydrolase family 65, partial [Deltaproteobacteria bacterium]|nr:glycoside hydrolase family 65 [Deltaproteobacteria bacterium]